MKAGELSDSQRGQSSPIVEENDNLQMMILDAKDQLNYLKQKDFEDARNSFDDIKAFRSMIKLHSKRHDQMNILDKL